MARKVLSTTLWGASGSSWAAPAKASRKIKPTTLTIPEQVKFRNRLRHTTITDDFMYGSALMTAACLRTAAWRKHRLAVRWQSYYLLANGQWFRAKALSGLAHRLPKRDCKL